jgi:hypothetical protein
MTKSNLLALMGLAAYERISKRRASVRALEMQHVLEAVIDLGVSFPNGWCQLC